MKASDLFVKCLEEEKIEYIFGVPGEENADFMISLEESKKIKFILTRHEQGAACVVTTATESYPVFVGWGLLDELSDIFKNIILYIVEISRYFVELLIFLRKVGNKVTNSVECNIFV